MLPRDTLRILGDWRFREMDSASWNLGWNLGTCGKSNIGSAAARWYIRQKGRENAPVLHKYRSGEARANPVAFEEPILSSFVDSFHQSFNVEAVDRRLAVAVTLKVDPLSVRRKHGRNLVGMAGAVFA